MHLCTNPLLDIAKVYQWTFKCLLSFVTAYDMNISVCK